MSDLIAISLFGISITVVPIWLSRFYLNITQDADPSTLPHKLRGLAKWLPYATISTALAWLLLGLLWFSAEVVPLLFFVSILGVALSTLLIPVALISKSCRDRAASSIEGKLAGFMFVVAIFTVKVSWKAFVYFVKLAADSRSQQAGSYDGASNRSPYGYHGYESYEEKAQRKFGSGNF